MSPAHTWIKTAHSIVWSVHTFQCLRFEPIAYTVYGLLFYSSSLSLSLAFLLSIQMVQGQMRISNFIYIVFLTYIYFISIFEFVICVLLFLIRFVDCYCYFSLMPVVTCGFYWRVVYCGRILNVWFWLHVMWRTHKDKHTRTAIIPLRSIVLLRQPKTLWCAFVSCVVWIRLFLFERYFFSIHLYWMSVLAFAYFVLRLRENSLVFFLAFFLFTSRHLFHSLQLRGKHIRIHMPYGPINGQF